MVRAYFAISDLFAHPVLTDLARKLDHSAPAVLLPITRANRTRAPVLRS
jgi:hypothetical protein